MKVLVVGGGGREHALAWRLSLSESVDKVWIAPGNPGTAAEPGIENLPVTDIEELAQFAKTNGVELTVVGPEAPLAKGLVNVFRREGLSVFGPTKEAAQLESSKDFAKAFMKRHGIPTADYETFSDPEKAHIYLDKKARRSSSRLTALPPARASSSRWILKPRTAPWTTCSKVTNSVPPVPAS